MTPQLHDDGEELWDNKFHLCCGGIYLDDYTNVDVVGEIATPENIQTNRTTITDYYARLDGTCSRLPTHRPNVIDLRADMRDFLAGCGSVSKIVCIQGLEHLNSQGVDDALSNWYRFLSPGGVLIVSVPDMDATIELLHHEDTRDFAIRHLGGSRRDEWNYHKSWFNTVDVIHRLWEAGFAVAKIEVLPNIHLYPAIVCRAVK